MALAIIVNIRLACKSLPGQMLSLRPYSCKIQKKGFIWLIRGQMLELRILSFPEKTFIKKTGGEFNKILSSVRNVCGGARKRGNMATLFSPWIPPQFIVQPLTLDLKNAITTLIISKQLEE